MRISVPVATCSRSPARTSDAAPPELDAAIFPAGEGLIVADAHGAEILRLPEPDPLPPARRKAMLLKLARLGAHRVHRLMDPEAAGGDE